MDYQTVDPSFADRLASKEFDPQEFIREIVSESIGDSDVLANKVKLQAFAERTARNLRDSVTRNYSKFLTTADEVAMLEDEMYHLRSLSNHYRAIMNFLKDFIIREELRDTQMEKSTNLQWKTTNDVKGSDEDSTVVPSGRDETHLLTSLSILIDQAESIGLISQWKNKIRRGRHESIDRRLSLYPASEGNQKGDSISSEQANEAAVGSLGLNSAAFTTDDGRKLLYRTYLTLLDSDTLLEKTHIQLFLLEGCILLCTSTGSAFQDSANPSFADDPLKPSFKSSGRLSRLNLLTAIDVDGSLSVTDVKDTAELSAFGSVSFRNTFKLTKSGREIFILKASSAQSKAACINNIVSYLDLVTESGNGNDKVYSSGWSNPSSSEGNDVILSLLSDQLSELELAICHRQQNLAEELILQCRQRFSNLSPDVRSSSQGSRVGFTLNQLEQKLVKQIRNGPKTLQERGRNGLGLRDPKREINLLKRLGYNSDAIELFIQYQRMSFSNQRRSEPVYGMYSSTSNSDSNYRSTRMISKTAKDHIRDVRTSFPVLDVAQYNESFSDTLKSQIEHELNNRICLFFDSIRRAEQNFYDNFSTERTECASTFLVWLGAEIEVSVDNILHEACGAQESSDGCWMLGRIAEVVKMIANGASSIMNSCNIGSAFSNVLGVSDGGDERLFEKSSQRLDIEFLIEEKLANVLNFAIREDKQKMLEVIRSWSRSDNFRLTNEPLHLFVRSVEGEFDDSNKKTYISRLISPPTILYELINLAPEIVDEMNKLIVPDETTAVHETVQMTEEHTYLPVTLGLTYHTVVFCKLLITFATQCFSVYMEKTKQAIVESIVEIMKLYLRLLGQSFTRATDEGLKQQAPDTDTVHDEGNSAETPDAEFIFANIKFVVSVLFKLVDMWFKQMTGSSSKYFSKIYEKLDRFETEIEAYRKQISF